MYADRKPIRSTQIFTGIVAVSVAAVAAALISQYYFDMQPCPWCILQRTVFLAIALVGVVGLIWRSTAGRVVSSSVVIVLALAGVVCALWQHFVAAKSQSCNFTLADKIISHYSKLDRALPSVFEVRATCADAVVDLLGIPYDFWSLAVFLSLGGAAAYCIATGRRWPGA